MVCAELKLPAISQNNDGIVDANELIKYVNDSVPMATDNKQHPREFGTYDNSLRLSASPEGLTLTPFGSVFMTGSS